MVTVDADFPAVCWHSINGTFVFPFLIVRKLFVTSADRSAGTAWKSFWANSMLDCHMVVVKYKGIFLHFKEKDLTNLCFVRGAIPNKTRVLILCGTSKLSWSTEKSEMWQKVHECDEQLSCANLWLRWRYTVTRLMIFIAVANVLAITTNY